MPRMLVAEVGVWKWGAWQVTMEQTPGTEGMSRSVGLLRGILLVAAIAALAVGIYGGLVRIGAIPYFGPELALSHGPIMLCGLFGTLISLERAVAMERAAWTYIAPALFAVGLVGLLAGAPALVPALLFVAGAAVLTAGALLAAWQQPALFTLTPAAGAAALLVGNALWAAGTAIPDLVVWWVAFLVSTIAAERLELSRALRLPATARPVFVAALALLFAGAAIGFGSDLGRPATGAALLATAAWLARFDTARTLIGRPGATRYSATAMLAGYFWLAVAGLLLLAGGGLVFQYDLALHAVFIGFLLSMLFGHAPIVLPTVTGIKLGYRNTLYVPLALLQLSVILRVLGGLWERYDIRMFSGPLTAAALMVFAGVVLSLVRPKRAPGGRGAGRGSNAR